MTTSTKPLAGLTVVELGSLIAGPFAARIMQPDRRTLRRAHHGRVRRRGDQDRITRRRRPLAQVAQALPGHLAVVVRAVAQQAVGDDQPETSGRPRDRAQAGRRSRHPGREFPPRCARKARSGLAGAVGHQPRPGDAPPVGLWPERPAGAATRLWRDRRVDGRAALCHRFPRSTAGQDRHIDRRFDRRAVGSDPRCGE